MKDNYDKVVELWKSFEIKDSKDLESHLESFSRRFAYHSGAIKNSQITFHDTLSIFDHDRVIGYTGSLRTIREIDNLKDAYRLILRCFEEKRPLNLDLVCEMHYEITKWTNKEHCEKVNLHDRSFPMSEATLSLQKDIHELMEIGSSTPLLSAAWFLAKFEFAHIFKDGNGRTGRALMNYYLISNGHPPIIIHVEDQQYYYDALHKFYTKSDLSSLIEFLKNQAIKTWKASVKRHEISRQYELGEITNASHPVKKYGLKSILENGSKLTNKYKMSLQDNIFFAKRNLVDSIWKEAVIEGIDISFPATKEIFEGRTVVGLSVKDTIAISNLKLAWQFILDNIEQPVDLAYIQQVNQAIGATIINNCGQLRHFPVSIGGTNWRPELPDPDKATATIKEIMAQEPGEERALHMFSYLCRTQLFCDGNKRTAQLVANKMLIADGAGILAIPTDHKQDFGILSVDFYETGNDTKLLAFLDETSIGGIFPNPERERQIAEHNLEIDNH